MRICSVKSVKYDARIDLYERVALYGEGIRGMRVRM